MALASNGQTAIVRTERGLTISGTRLSIYDVMDFLKAHYPPHLIRDKFNLTDDQMNAALAYIEANRAQIETEYQQVLENREAIRQYWEEQNQERFAQIATTPRHSKQAALWAKLKEQKASRTAEK